MLEPIDDLMATNDAAAVAEADGRVLVDLRPISTPRERCLMLAAGAIDEAVLTVAAEHRFDHLPVLDRRGRLSGMIATVRARALYDAREELDPELHQCELCVLPPSVDIFQLLDCLEQHRAVVYRDPRGGAQVDDWFALVTISDLNRHPFRADLYPLLAALESALADLIDRRFEDPWMWLSATNEDAQVRLLGRWELERQRGVEVSPITGCTLIELINIVAKSRDLLADLGFPSRRKFDDLTGSFREVRNQIMHPVRPLILGAGDVAKLRETLRGVIDLTRKTDVLNEMEARTRLDLSRIRP